MGCCKSTIVDSVPIPSSGLTVTFPRKLYVHGKMLGLEGEEGGGAGIIRMKVDSYLDQGGAVVPAKPVVVTFFFPNYDPNG